MRAQITFRNGVQIEFDVENLETARSLVGDGLTKMKWDTPDDWSRELHTVELSEIIAIVAIRDEDEAAPTPAADPPVVSCHCGWTTGTHRGRAAEKAMADHVNETGHVIAVGVA